jgi:hypothetical protein
VSNTLPRIYHSVQYRGWSQAGQILGTEAQLANSPEPRSVAAQRCGVFLAFLTTSDREASRVSIFREREKSIPNAMALGWVSPFLRVAYSFGRAKPWECEVRIA